MSRLVECRGLSKGFERRSTPWGDEEGTVRAVQDVSLDVRTGETVGLVGESGSGKSTLGRSLIRLIEPDAGVVIFDGTDLMQLAPPELRKMRRHFQMVFQDPYASLNPRMTVGTAIGEPLAIHRLVSGRADRHARVAELLENVGLDRDVVSRYPHEFSGGQRQRIGIARAIACSPQFIVADEPVSALDPPVQAQIINLLVELQERMGMAYLLIAHDLRLVRHVCDRVAVMYLGRIVEEATAERLYGGPAHPYSQALLASTPAIRPGAPEGPRVTGDPPSPLNPPQGCPFHPRCPIAEPECASVTPELRQVSPDHRVACHMVS